METPAQAHHDNALVEGAKDIAFGSVAGMVSKVFEHPFDLCKVRLQSQVLDSTARFNGPIDCLMQTWRNEGIRGLYRGLPAPIVGAMAENATLFLAYGQLQHVIRWWTGSTAVDLPISQIAMAAAGAGTITSFMLTPIELVKCKMQVQLLALESVAPAVALQQLGVSGGKAEVLGISPKSSTPNFRALPGPFAILRTIIRSHGLRGLWLGQTGTLLRETGGSAAWFSTKEALCSYFLARRARQAGEPRTALTKRDLLAWESALAGAAAGVSYNIALFPADSVKSALQTAEELRPRAAGEAGPTFWAMAREMYAKQGVRGLYAGCGITIARAIPSSAMIFLIYDGLSKRFG